MRKIAVAFILIITSFLLVGCEEKNQPKLDPESDSTIPMTFQIWTDSNRNFFEALSREFFAEIQRQNIKIKVIKFDSKEQLESFLLNAMSEGYGPDVIYITGNWVSSNFDKLLPREGDETFMPKDFSSLFVRSANETLLQNNKIYGVPMGIDSLGLYYNEEHILDRLPDRNIPAKTWQGIEDDVTYLSKQDNSLARFSSSGIAMGRFDNILYGFDILENIIIQFGGEFFTEDKYEANFFRKKGSIDGRSVSLGLKAFDLFTSFADNRFKYYSWSEFLAHSETKYKNFETFAKGDVSMIFGYANDLKTIKEVINKQRRSRQKTILEKNVRVTFFPQVNDPSLGGVRKIIARVHALAVPKNTNKPKLAWNFLKFAIRKENLQSFFDETSLPTPRVDMIKEQETNPKVGVFVRQAKYARANIYPKGISKKYIENGFSRMIAVINKGTGAISRLLQNFEQEVTQNLKSYIKLIKLTKPFENNKTVK